MFTKLGENETQMFCMLFVGFGVDKDVIEIDHNELVDGLHEDKIHETRESRRSIGEAERHDGVLVETVASGEGCLGNVFLSDLYLVVAHP